MGSDPPTVSSSKGVSRPPTFRCWFDTRPNQRGFRREDPNLRDGGASRRETTDAPGPRREGEMRGEFSCGQSNLTPNGATGVKLKWCSNFRGTGVSRCRLPRPQSRNHKLRPSIRSGEDIPFHHSLSPEDDGPVRSVGSWSSVLCFKTERRLEISILNSVSPRTLGRPVKRTVPARRGRGRGRGRTPGWGLRSGDERWTERRPRPVLGFPSHRCGVCVE